MGVLSQAYMQPRVPGTSKDVPGTAKGVPGTAHSLKSAAVYNGQHLNQRSAMLTRLETTGSTGS